jgi:rod shape-determining protein MreD
MTAPRWLLAGVLLVTALLLQSVVLTRLPLPGATPDLLLVVVIALAMRGGPVTGVVAGFSAGLGWDLISPADGPVGGWALIYLLIGLLAGRVSHPEDRPALEVLGIVAGLCALSVAGYALLGWFLGDPRVMLSAVAAAAAAAALYGAVLTPFVQPLVQRLLPSGADGARL